MFLYYRVVDDIFVYYMMPKYSKIVDFKNSEIKSFGDVGLYSARTNNRDCCFLDCNHNYCYYRDINSGGLMFHKMLKCDDFDRLSLILNNFYKGYLKTERVMVVRSSPSLKHLLLISDLYNFCDGSYVMNDVVSIPESLYLLHLLEKGKFDKIDLDEYDISRQLDLFNISNIPVFKISMDKFDKQSIFDLSRCYGYESDLDGFNGERTICATQKILKKYNILSK